ncbi:PQQ-binding-like beta-propeller repeat protein [Marinobacter nauticus]|uniref:PQQ-binding-like beta-propeller repeat protein n=1 Tax=Marinobacter nauticus TaxID=2743 RepID=UPI001CFC683F|nr:PQQ-binding-like beta-propeller repeat protein [Marinobacter nauticus]
MRAVPAPITVGLLAFIAILAACTAAVTPEWVATYNHGATSSDNRITWLNDIAVDSYSDVLVAGTAIQTGLSERQEEAVFVKFSPTGERIWVGKAALQRTDNDGSARFFDDTRALVVDNQGNLYSIAITQRTTDDSTTFSSHLVSFNRNGEQRWTRKLSDQEDMRALALNGDQVVVAGLSTQRFSLTGNKLSHVDHPEHSAWHIAFNSDGSYALTGGWKISLFSPAGEPLWQADADQEGTALGESLFTMDGDLITTQSVEPRGAGLVTRWDQSGQKIWQKTLAAPASSYGLMGPVLVEEDYRGDLYFVTSNADGRRIAKLDGLGGFYWNKTSRSGIVQDMALINGEVFAVGDGRNEKYDTNGQLVAESKTGRSVQITQGRVAVDGDLIYAGYAATMDGGMGLHISQFKNR